MRVKRSIKLISSILTTAALTLGSGSAFAYQLHTLYSLPSDAVTTQAGLVMGKNGYLYGTTSSGGVNSYGTIFEVFYSATAEAWEYQKLYDFCSLLNCADGRNPQTALITDNNGNLYGTTYYGGSTACNGGCGVAFKFNTKFGTPNPLTVLYTFCSAAGCADGVNPLASLSYLGAGPYDGTSPLYGTTKYGGNGTNSGTVFELTQSGGGSTWTETPLWQFCALQQCTDGAGPEAAVTVRSNAIYGTTYNGGGTAFELTNWNTSPSLKTLAQFGNDPAGDYPASDIFFESANSLFGTTFSSNGANAQGVIFNLQKSAGEWSDSTVYTFCSLAGCSDGNEPSSGRLLNDSTGTLWGATTTGGDDTCGPFGVGCGTIYTFSPTSGLLQTIVTFEDDGNGGKPNGSLIEDSSGNIYGTTGEGGTNNTGTVFVITP